MKESTNHNTAIHGEEFHNNYTTMNTGSKRRVSKQDNLKVSLRNRNASSPGDSQSYYTNPISGIDETKREKGYTRRIIITQFVDSMIENIVESWITGDDANDGVESKHSDTQSETSTAATSTIYIKSLIAESPHTSNSSLSSSKGIIRFLNDNVYEGDLVKNRMHGVGCYRWANGTKYRGQFKDNRITGTGIIEFKDNSWYEGEFLNNVRHGKGLYVDSGRQRSYFGHWSGGAKHGQGVMYYTGSAINSYDGEWCNNQRHGPGLRRYCPKSGYDGDWNNNVRDGNGLMIWPNADMYDGEWKNDLMCGNSKYIWSSFNNDSMSLPAQCMYRGSWDGGLRNGQGVVDFGFGTGSCYRGQFKNNRKNGVGQLVTNDGLLVEDILFIDDSISMLDKETGNENSIENKMILEMCNEIELEYHIRETFQTSIEFRDNNIIKKYMVDSHNLTEKKFSEILNNDVVTDFTNLLEFEISSLSKSLIYYQKQLKHIYYVYATICNVKEIQFEPILIRLYLWQMYYDCGMHHKGLTLCEIDELLSRNANWQTKQPHDPFEAIYFWQFLHSLISVATQIYTKKYITNRKPNAVLASAFKQFIDEDILPRVGKLVNGYGRIIPLKSLYLLYLSLESPCTVQSVISRIHKESSQTDKSGPNTLKVFGGKNAYLYDNEVSFIFDNIQPYVLDLSIDKQGWDLSSLNNVPPKAIIEIFSTIFPQIIEAKRVMILDIKLTFFEFFEAFVALVEESIKIEEIANYTLVQ